MEVLERMPFEKKNFIFSKLAEIAEVRKLKPEEQRAYDVSLKRYRDSNAIMKTERDAGRAEGIAIGEAKGFAIGEAKGIAIGEAKGFRITARKMKDRGMDAKDIQELTGLTAEEIKEL